VSPPSSLRERVRGVYMRPGAVRRVPLGIAAGLRLEVDPRAPVQVYLGTAEVEIAGHIKRLARPGLRAFDIGGHNAYYAMVLARLTQRPVISFEFDPAGVERMHRNLALNPPLADRVEIRQVYLSYERNDAHGAATLDEIVARDRLAPPDLLKIDVEGSESRVLQGAADVLRRRPHLVIETHGPTVERECVEILRASGYTPRIVTQRRRLREHRAPDNRWLIAEGRP
jgi:Methyltransferase FkbM domain